MELMEQGPNTIQVTISQNINLVVADREREQSGSATGTSQSAAGVSQEPGGSVPLAEDGASPGAIFVQHVLTIEFEAPGTVLMHTASLNPPVVDISDALMAARAAQTEARSEVEEMCALTELMLDVRTQLRKHCRRQLQLEGASCPFHVLSPGCTYLLTGRKGLTYLLIVTPFLRLQCLQEVPVHHPRTPSSHLTHTTHTRRILPTPRCTPGPPVTTFYIDHLNIHPTSHIDPLPDVTILLNGTVGASYTISHPLTFRGAVLYMYKSVDCCTTWGPIGAGCRCERGVPAADHQRVVGAASLRAAKPVRGGGAGPDGLARGHECKARACGNAGTPVITGLGSAFGTHAKGPQ